MAVRLSFPALGRRARIAAADADVGEETSALGWTPPFGCRAAVGLDENLPLLVEEASRKLQFGLVIGR